VEAFIDNSDTAKVAWGEATPSPTNGLNQITEGGILRSKNFPETQIMNVHCLFLHMRIYPPLYDLGFERVKSPLRVTHKEMQQLKFSTPYLESF
jgi:hypothetical protein